MNLFGGKLLVTGGFVFTLAGLLLFGLGGAATTIGLETDIPPPGAVTVAASDSTPTVGETVTVSVTVVDANGDPVGDADCTFSIASQPGTDDSVDGAPVTTDSAGNASTSLNVGSTAGTIEVQADCGGITASVSVVAGTSSGGGGEAAPPPASLPDAAPPASLPDTGSGGVVDDGQSMRAIVIALLAGFGVMLAGAGILVGRLGRRVTEEA